ncbi:MAG: SDR family oxidoreductase [Planctomycetota bacterium]|jgi:dTDP-4-dehydrorhamnose reductase
MKITKDDDRDEERLLVIGASGQVGGALEERFGSGGALVGTYRSQAAQPAGRVLELADVVARPGLAESLLDEVRPGVVVIAGAMTHVDGCEESGELAMRINRDAPAVIARAAHVVGARTVFLSSEYVFDGESGPYSEEDVPHPLSVYGCSKLEGEAAVLAADPRALVLRTTVVYGPEEQGKNSAYRLASLLHSGMTLLAAQDQVSSPTYNRDLAEAMARLLEIGAAGIFNVVGPEVMNRLVFARRLAVAAGLDARLIEGVDTASLNQRAPRPLNAGLKIEKLRAALPALRLHTVEEAARDWMANPRGKPWPAA